MPPRACSTEVEIGTANAMTAITALAAVTAILFFVCFIN
jgi:hypothetical protein